MKGQSKLVGQLRCSTVQGVESYFFLTRAATLAMETKVKEVRLLESANVFKEQISRQALGELYFSLFFLSFSFSLPPLPPLTRSHYVIGTDLKYVILLPCLNLPSAGISDPCSHTWLSKVIL